MLYVRGNQKKVGVACSSTSDWIRKTPYFYTMESYSVGKKAHLEALVGKWTQLEIMLLDEIARSHMGGHYVVSLVERTKGAGGIQYAQ